MHISRDGTCTPPHLCGYEGGVDNPVRVSSDVEFVLTLHLELEDDEEWNSDEDLSDYDGEQMEHLKEAAELVTLAPFVEISSKAIKN